MFTGIIETIGVIKSVNSAANNKEFVIQSSISSELKIDQSVSHNGVCLTVVEVASDTHKVVAIDETLKRSALNNYKEGDKINLERAMLVNSRLDGHFVQGHVDAVAICRGKKDEKGSWIFTFRHSSDEVIVKKGSVCIDGVSLTVTDVDGDEFSVAVIPYTLGNTNFQQIEKGSEVNIEFDIIGKYIRELYRREGRGN